MKLDIDLDSVTRCCVSHRFRFLAWLTDACIPHLAKLTSRTELAIHENNITESALVGLAPLVRLNYLVVGVLGADFEDPFHGVAALSRALPKTDILIACHQVSFLNGVVQ